MKSAFAVHSLAAIQRAHLFTCYICSEKLGKMLGKKIVQNPHMPIYGKYASQSADLVRLGPGVRCEATVLAKHQPGAVMYHRVIYCTAHTIVTIKYS